MTARLQVFADLEALNDSLAQRWRVVAKAAISERGGFHVALAGGNTPRKLYQRLTEPDFRESFPWSETHIYFGDERCVAQDHVDSNYHMARESLLSHVPVPESQVHAMFDPIFSPDENAERYAKLLKQKLARDVSGQPVFDLILLGMGDDGHTASLFPDTELLQETTKLVGANYVQKLQAWRISLTFPVINAARHVVLQVAGAGKAEMMAAIAGQQTTACPVQRVKPQGQLDWYLDRAAARLLPADFPP